MATDATPTRILIAAACFADADAAMRLIDRILTAPPAELAGVLVDDDIWTNILRLPEQKVVTSAGMMVAPPSTQQARALHESDARAFRKRLEAFARTRSVKWSFEQRRGPLMHSVSKDVATWDILLLGHCNLHRRQGQVVVIASDQSETGRGVQMARSLSHVLKTSVVVLPHAGEIAPKDEASAAGDTHVAPRMLSELSRINASAVVVDLPAEVLQRADLLPRILDAARCPVVVMGASTADNASNG